MVRDKIVMVMAYVKLILGKVVDNYKMPLLNNDMQFSSVGRMPTDEPIKDTRSDVYLQLGILSMDVSMDMKTQVVCKTFHPQRGLSTYSKTIKEALRNGGLRRRPGGWKNPRGAAVVRCCTAAVEEKNRTVTLKNGNDSLDICRILNGMWQTSGGWGRIDRNDAVQAMLNHADAGLTTFDMADHYGPAEDLYGIFINKVRRERPPEYLETVRGLTKWVPPPVKMTGSFVKQNIDVSRKRMDVASLDMLQFHWWDYSNPGYLDALKHLTDLKEAGKIKTVALTNFDTERLQIILENDIPIVSNQVQHSIVDMRPQQKMAELCQLSGVKLITYGTVMGGLLSEKFLDTNLMIPFAGPQLNTPSLQKYKRVNLF